MTKTITIPKSYSLEQEKELVLIPRQEYEALVRIKMRGIPEIRLSARQRKNIQESEKELAQGHYLTLDELERNLARSRTKKS